MAENTNYIGVAMGLDVTDLKHGLTVANQQIQAANSEFKAASAGMDDWRKSTEGITAKVKQLETVLASQNAKLSGIQAEYDEQIKVQEKLQKEYDDTVAAMGKNSKEAENLKSRLDAQKNTVHNLNVSLNNQKAVVAKTEKEFNNFSNVLQQAEEGTIDLEKVTINAKGELKEMGDAAADAGEKVEGGFGPAAAKAIGGGLAAIGGAIAGAVTAFFGLAESTREYREDIGKLQTAFETAGHTTEEATETYKELFSVFGEEDRAVEAAQQIAKLAKNEEEMAKMTNIATGVWGTFGDSLPAEGLMEAVNSTSKIGEVQGNLADALEWSGTNLDDFNDKLATMKTEEERSAYILDHLNGLYGEAADNYREVNKDIIEAQRAQSEMTDALAELGKIAEPIMTVLKNLATETLKEITPFVQMMGEGLRGAMEGTAGATEMLADGIGGIVDALLTRVTEMLPTVLQLILDLLPSIADTLLSALPSLLQVISDLAVQILNLLSTLLPSIVTKIVELIPILIEQLLLAVPQLLEAAVTLLMSIVQALPVIIESLISALPSLLETISSTLITAIPLLLEAAIQLFNAIIDALPVIIESLLVHLPRIVQTIIDFLIQSLPLLLDGAISLLMAIIDALPVIIDLLIVEVPKVVSTISSALIDNIDVLIQAAIDLFFGILEAIPEIQSELISQMPDIITSICEGLLNSIDDMIQAGKDLMAGLVDGIFDFDFKGAISGLGDKVVGAFNKVFDSHSPSRLIEDNVGVNVGAAVVPSNPSALSQVKKRLNAFSEYVSENLGDIKANLDVGGDVASGGAVRGVSRSTVINAGMTVNYNGNLSRKKLKQLENDNYTAVKLRLQAEGAI